MKRSEDIKELLIALAKAQGDMEPAELDAFNPHFQKPHASLGAVMKAIKKPFAPVGLSVVQGFSDDKKDWETYVFHTSGQWIMTSIPAVNSDNHKQSIHAVGSTITYLRRYGVGPATGVVSEVDDDGNEAEDKSKGRDNRRQEERPPQQNQQQNKPKQPPQSAPPTVAAAPGSYVIQIGKNKGKKIQDVTDADLQGLAKHFNDLKAKGTVLGSPAIEFLLNYTAYLKAVPQLEKKPEPPKENPENDQPATKMQVELAMGIGKERGFEEEFLIEACQHIYNVHPRQGLTKGQLDEFLNLIRQENTESLGRLIYEVKPSQEGQV